jgi:hypothetical protein
MKQFSKKEKIRLISQLYWDLDIDPYELYKLIIEENQKVGHISRNDLFCRILKTYDWHKIQRLIPSGKLKELLNEDVLSRIAPTDLKKRFLYAREVLSR